MKLIFPLPALLPRPPPTLPPDSLEPQKFACCVYLPLGAAERNDFNSCHMRRDEAEDGEKRKVFGT